MSHEVRMNFWSVPLWPIGALCPGGTLVVLVSQEMRSAELPKHLLRSTTGNASHVRDVDVVRVFLHFSPEIGLSVNPLFHSANSALNPTIPSLSVSS